MVHLSVLVGGCMNELRRDQAFKYYVNAFPAAVAAELQADMAAGTLGHIKQMGVLQFQTNIAVWVLWEKEFVV